MKEYIFNDCGSCTNADEVGYIDFCNYISVAQCPDGLWRYGYCFRFDAPDMYGGGFAVSSHMAEWNKGYTTRNDAIIAAIMYLKDLVKRNTEYTEEQHKNIDKCIEKAYMEITQLSLFD